MTSLASTVKTLPKLYESLSKELKTSQSFANEIFNAAKNTNNEWEQDKFLNVTKSLETGTSLIAELAQLNKEDATEIAKKNFEIDNSIKAIQKEKEELAYAGLLTKELASTFDSMTGYLNNNRVAAGKFASQSKEVKEIYEELGEELHSINKFFKKLTTTAEVFLSSTRGKIALVAFGAGEIAEKFGEIGKKIGVGMTQMVGLKTQVGLVGAILGEEAGEAALDLAKDLGDSHHLTMGMAVDAGLLASNYNLSAKQAAFMSTAFGELSGKSYETGKNTGEYVKQLAMANGVAPTQVMQDVADNAEFFALYSKDGGKNIGDAAVAAAKLGVGLGTAAKVADHLLDYQSSVQDEMEASVLLGRDMNLSKARELAYNGDIAGALKEGLEAAGGIAAYNAMDPYQRAATAKAIGVSNAEMQQMVAHEETLNGMHGVGNQIYSQTSEILQNMGNTLTGKVLKGMGGLVLGAGEYSRALKDINSGPMAGIVAKGLDLVKSLFKASTYTKAMAAMKSFGGRIGGISKSLMAGKSPTAMYESLRGKGVGAADALKQSGASAKSVLGKKAKNSIKANATDSIKNKINPTAVTQGTDSVAKSTATAGKGDDGSNFKTKAENIAAGLKYFASGKVFIGALNLIPVGIGLLGLLPGLPTLFILSKMDLSTVGTGLMNLAIGVGFMGTGNVFMGALGLLATAVGLTAMLLGIPAMIAIGVFGQLAATGLTALGGGLATFGATAPAAIIGIGLLALFGAALIPLTYALSLLAPLVTAVGTVIAMVFTSMASAFVTIASALPTMVTSFLPLIAMILPIFGLAAAISALSLSLLMLGTMGLVALPVLAALGAVGGMAMNLFGGEGGGSNDEMIAILKSIDSKVGGAPAINIDSKKLTVATNDGAARNGSSGGTKY
jgi:hypothetical protein